jgi:hypothetical protein
LLRLPRVTALSFIPISGHPICSSKANCLLSLQLQGDGRIAAATVGECLIATLGPVGAVAGVILMIVMAFLPQPAPDRPSDDYMTERGNQFLAKLSLPPPGWSKSSPGVLNKAAV